MIRDEGVVKSSKNKVPQKITFRDQISLVDADPNPYNLPEDLNDPLTCSDECFNSADPVL